MSHHADDVADVPSPDAGSADARSVSPAKALSPKDVLAASTAHIYAYDRSGRCVYASPAGATEAPGGSSAWHPGDLEPTGNLNLSLQVGALAGARGVTINTVELSYEGGRERRWQRRRGLCRRARQAPPGPVVAASRAQG